MYSMDEPIEDYYGNQMPPQSQQFETAQGETAAEYPSQETMDHLAPIHHQHHLRPESGRSSSMSERRAYDPAYEFNYDTKTMSEEERKKLKLHQGSVVQFPEKNPNPNYKNELAEYSHIDETAKYMKQKPTVSQFPEKNPNPNYKNELAEYSHIDESTRYMIQKPTVAQFTDKVPDYDHLRALPEKPHLPEEEEYNRRLQLHQGSVLQLPKHAEYERVRKFIPFRPNKQLMAEQMPIARVPNPDHLLPSQAKRMQTYITHPSGRTMRSVAFASSAPTSPTLSRKQHVWPPTRSQVKQLPRTGFNPAVTYADDGRKQFVWPPTEVNRFGSMNDLRPVPTIGSGPAANAWQPEVNLSGSTSGTGFGLQTQRLQPIWPPPQTGSMTDLTAVTPERVRTPGQSDEYVRHPINSSIPSTYRTPPGTQFYRVPYDLQHDQTDTLNEQMQDMRLYSTEEQQLYDQQQQQQQLQQQSEIDQQRQQYEQQQFERQQFEQQNFEMQQKLHQQKLQQQQQQQEKQQQELHQQQVQRQKQYEQQIRQQQQFEQQIHQQQQQQQQLDQSHARPQPRSTMQPQTKSQQQIETESQWDQRFEVDEQVSAKKAAFPLQRGALGNAAWQPVGSTGPTPYNAQQTQQQYAQHQQRYVQQQSKQNRPHSPQSQSFQSTHLPPTSQTLSQQQPASSSQQQLKRETQTMQRSMSPQYRVQSPQPIVTQQQVEQHYRQSHVQMQQQYYVQH